MRMFVDYCPVPKSLSMMPDGLGDWRWFVSKLELPMLRTAEYGDVCEHKAIEVLTIQPLHVYAQIWEGDDVYIWEADYGWEPIQQTVLHTQLRRTARWNEHLRQWVSLRMNGEDYIPAGSNPRIACFPPAAAGSKSLSICRGACKSAIG